MARKKIDVEITKIDPDHIVKWLDRLYDLVVEDSPVPRVGKGYREPLRSRHGLPGRACPSIGAVAGHEGWYGWIPIGTRGRDHDADCDSG